MARVLVVDDNPDTALTLSMLIAHWGHSVRTAAEGTEALHIGQEFAPEIVLLDVGLPGMDGYEVAGRLREQPETRPALLVAITGYGSAEDRRTAFASGFDLHITKPVDPIALRKLLDQGKAE